MVDIPLLVRRADAYAKATQRSRGGVSKALFDDVRTLDLLRKGNKDITISRLERASQRLVALEERRRVKERS